ncbi:MAG: hypothetical protein LUD46_11705 [Parabacteroides sp.]|nr:hypothetical protein [Parabacteroides sp.]
MLTFICKGYLNTGVELRAEASVKGYAEASVEGYADTGVEVSIKAGIEVYADTGFELPLNKRLFDNRTIVVIRLAIYG